MYGDSCYEFVQHYGSDFPEGSIFERWNEIAAHEKNIPAILTEQVQRIISKVFLPERPMQPIPMDISLESLHCWSPNVYGVKREMRRIADLLEERTSEQVSAGMLHFMSDARDRSHAHMNSADPLYCGHNGRPCGLAQVCGTTGLLKKEWLAHTIEIIENLADYIYNRGFHNTRLSGTSHSEPRSIEWQIVRLASHTGTDASASIRAHWTMGKQFGISYFRKEISFEDRVRFSFPQISGYMAAGNVDEFTFFLAFLSLSPEDFQHPVLQDIYRKWAMDKNEAIATMLEIAWEEEFSWSDVRAMERLLSRYIGHFNLSW